METSAKAFEALLKKKLVLYQELAEIVKEEKKSLKNTDVDALWRYSEQKQMTASKIEDLRRQILRSLSRYHPDHGMNVKSFQLDKVLSLTPFKEDGKFRKICMTLSDLKEEVDGLVKGNKAFVEEYLAVLDDMINIIVSAGKNEPLYEKTCFGKKRKNANLILHKEV